MKFVEYLFKEEWIVFCYFSLVLKYVVYTGLSYNVLQLSVALKENCLFIVTKFIPFF